MQDRETRLAELRELLESAGRILDEAVSTQDSQPLTAVIDILASTLEASVTDPMVFSATIDLSERALLALPEGDLRRVVLLANLGVALIRRYLETNNARELDRAVSALKQALAHIPEEAPARTFMLENLATGLRYRYDQSHDLADLDAALTAQQENIFRTQEGDPARLDRLSTLAFMLHARYQATADPEDLDRAIAALQQAVATSPEGSTIRPLLLDALSDGLATRYYRTNKPSDLDGIIVALEQGVAASPKGEPSAGRRLGQLFRGLTTRYDKSHHLADLDGAVDAATQALGTIPEGSEDYSPMLSLLGSTLRIRYSQTHDLEDLDRAAATLERLVAVTPSDATGRAAMLDGLTEVLRHRYRATNDLRDLTKLVNALERSVAASPEGDPDRATRLRWLGVALRDRYHQTGDPVELNRAIDVLELSNYATSLGHDDAANLAALGSALRERFDNGGDRADVDVAINLLERAAAATPVDDTSRSSRLCNLGFALRNRHNRYGDRADIAWAVSVLAQAVDACSIDDPDLNIPMSNLGSALMARFSLDGDRRDLDRAIDTYEQALAATPEGHAARAGWLSNLGSALNTRYGHTHLIADLDRSVSLCEQAVANADPQLPDYPGWISNLGAALAQRYEAAGELKYIDRGIHEFERAVEETHVDHPDRAGRLLNLGIALRTRFEQTRAPADLHNAVRSFKEAAEYVSAAPLLRARSAERWGSSAVLAGNFDQSVDALGLAVGLLGQVAPRGLARRDQEHQLAQLAGLGPEAAAACLQAGLPERAIELFEQGRAVLFEQALDSRTELGELAHAHPTLAETFTNLVVALDSPETTAPSDTNMSTDPGSRTRALAADAQRRRQSATELDRLLNEIRGKAGFAMFLKPRPFAELLAAANDGPIVMVNVAAQRSDALILDTTGIEVLPLPGLSPKIVTDRVPRFLDALNRMEQPDVGPKALEAAESQLVEELGWLWDTITGPVLEHLHLTERPAEGQPWPRVSWCASGPLAFLPLHAAGHHTSRFDRQPATVLDRVISSTTLTLRALIQTRPTAPLSGEDDRTECAELRILVVAMPETPGQQPLPGAALEARQIADLLPGHVDILGLPHTPPATYDTVINALPGHAWAHFSCHGASSLADPSASHLLLADYQTRPLSVLALNRTRLAAVELAFLSACSTARSGAALPDEPIHLAAACQLAGYRHVIATLWPIHDNDAVQVTLAAYRALVESGTAMNAADALHTAIHGLRAQYPNQPSRWASHTHTGPMNRAVEPSSLG